jgi:hypothetical protein
MLRGIFESHSRCIECVGSLVFRQYEQPLAISTEIPKCNL